MTREELEAEVERLRANAEARERVMRRENDILRAAERERDELRADNERYGSQLEAAHDRGVAEGERKATERIVAWLRDEPERLVACSGHRHADGKPCLVMSPMPADELADCIEQGEHHRKEEG